MILYDFFMIILITAHPQNSKYCLLKAREVK